MRKIMLVYGICILVVCLGFAYGPDLAQNQRVQQEKQIAQELAVKSDELWVLEGKTDLSIKTLEMSIDRLVLLAKNNKQDMSDEEYMELLNTIQQLKKVKELREVFKNDLQ